MFGSVFIFHFPLVGIDIGHLLRQTYRFPLYPHDIFIYVMKSTPQLLKSDCFHHSDAKDAEMFFLALNDEKITQTNK